MGAFEGDGLRRMRAEKKTPLQDSRADSGREIHLSIYGRSLRKSHLHHTQSSRFGVRPRANPALTVPLTRAMDAVEVDIKFLRFFKPVVRGDHIDGWRVCWIGGWDKCQVVLSS